MWHYVLTNPTSRFSSLVQWDVTCDIYIRVNSGTAESRTFTGNAWQEATGGVTYKAPWALELPMQWPSNGTTEIHGWEFVNGSTHADPFNVIP
jgi:hypothetical protein